MSQEQLIRTNDIGFFTPEYYTEVYNALTRQPNAENIHFLINAWGGNISVDVPVRERWARYESRFTISLNDIRTLVKDPALIAATVLTKLYYAYKPQLVMH